MTQNCKIVQNIEAACGGGHICAGDRAGMVDGDGLGGLMAKEMVKYAVSDDGKNGHI